MQVVISGVARISQGWEGGLGGLEPLAAGGHRRFGGEAPNRRRLGVCEQSPQPPKTREPGPSAGRFLQFFI